MVLEKTLDPYLSALSLSIQKKTDAGNHHDFKPSFRMSQLSHASVKMSNDKSPTLLICAQETGQKKLAQIRI